MTENIDKILKAWSDKSAPDSQELSRLTRGIVSAVVRQRHEEMAHARVPLRSKLLYAAVGAAVSLVIVLALRTGLRPEGVRPTGNGASLAAITTEEMRGIGRLYEETERMFADRLRWIAESNGDVGMGVEPIEGGLSEGAVPVLARIVVVSRRLGEDEWRKIWNTDVLLRSDEFVEVKPNPGTENRLALWVHPISDGAVAVDTRLALALPVEITSSASAVLPDGEAQRVMAFQRAGTEYRIYQTVKTLRPRGEA